MASTVTRMARRASLDEATIKFLTHLPKAELHLHLEGSISPPTLVTLSQRHDPVPLTLPQAEALYKYTSFDGFVDVWNIICNLLRTPADYASIAHDLLSTLATQGVRHAEIFVAVGIILNSSARIPVDDVFAALEPVRLDAERVHGLSVRWIVDASRSSGVEHVATCFAHAARLREVYPGIVGVGIGGREALAPSRWFADVYAEAKRNGLRLTGHCGESTGPVRGPEEIREALAMGVERLGHAYCAQYDEKLVDELAVSQTPVEISVTSNVCTNVCPTLQEHPIRRYFDRGLRCTINSDDPAMFRSYVLNEYLLVHQTFGFSLDEMKKLAENSFTSSFLEPEAKERFQEMIRRY